MWGYNHTEALYHHGVKGMKWGVRKARQAESDLRNKKAAIKKAKKAYSKSFNKAYNKSISAYSPIKKHRDDNDKRWNDAAKKAEALKKAKADYKSAKKEFNKNTTVGHKIGAALRSDGAKAAARVISKMALWNVTDDMFFSGAGKAAIKTTGRAAVTAFVMARGGYDIRWYDN